jgi:hypothetical protein
MTVAPMRSGTQRQTHGRRIHFSSCYAGQSWVVEVFPAQSASALKVHLKCIVSIGRICNGPVLHLVNWDLQLTQSLATTPAETRADTELPICTSSIICSQPTKGNESLLKNHAKKRPHNHPHVGKAVQQNSLGVHVCSSCSSSATLYECDCKEVAGSILNPAPRLALFIAHTS